MSCLGTPASGLGCCLPAWVAEDPGMGGGGAGGGVRGPTGRCILRGLLSLSGVKLRPAGSGAERGQRTFRRSGSATKPGPGRARGAVAVAERRRGGPLAAAPSRLALGGWAAERPRARLSPPHRIGGPLARCGHTLRASDPGAGLGLGLGTHPGRRHRDARGAAQGRGRNASPRLAILHPRPTSESGTALPTTALPGGFGGPGPGAEPGPQ